MSRKRTAPKSKYPMDLDEDSDSHSSASESYRNNMSDDNNGTYSDADSILKSILPPELLKKCSKSPSKGPCSKNNDDNVSVSSMGSEFSLAKFKSNKHVGKASKSSDHSNDNPTVGERRSSKANRVRTDSENSLEAIMAELKKHGCDVSQPKDHRSSKDVRGISKSSNGKHSSKEQTTTGAGHSDPMPDLNEDGGDGSLLNDRRNAKTMGSSKSASKHGSRMRKYSDESLDAIMAGLSDDGSEMPPPRDRRSSNVPRGASKSSSSKHSNKERQNPEANLDDIMAGLSDDGSEMPPPRDRRSSNVPRGASKSSSSKHSNKERQNPEANLDDIMAGLSDDGSEMPPPRDRRSSNVPRGTSKSNFNESAKQSKRIMEPHGTGQQEQLLANQDSSSTQSERQQHVHFVADARSGASVRFAPDTNQRGDDVCDRLPDYRARGQQQSLDRQRQQRQSQPQSSQQGQQMMMQQQQQSSQQLQLPAQFTFEVPSMGISQKTMSDEHIAKLKDWGQRIRQCIFQSNMAIKEKDTEISNRNTIIRSMQEEITKLKRDFELTNIGYQSEKDGRTSIEKRINGIHHLCVSLKDNAVSVEAVIKAVKAAHANAQEVVKKHQLGFGNITASLAKLEKNLVDSKVAWTKKFSQQQEANATAAENARASYEALSSQMAEKTALLEQCKADLTTANAASETLQCRISELQTLIEQANSEKETIQAELDTKQQQLQFTEEANAQLQSALNSLSEKCDILTVKVRELNEQKAAIESELSDTMVAHQSQVAELENQLMEYRLETDELKANIKALQTDLDEVNCSMAEMSDNLASLEAEIGRQARELADSMQQRNELKAQVETLELAKAECEASAQICADEVNLLRDKLLADEEHTDSLKTQLAELNGLIEEFKAETNDKTKQIEQRDEQNKLLQDELQRLKEAKAVMNDRIVDMECELASVKFDSDERQRQLELSISDLERQLAEKKSEADQLSEQVASLSASRDEAASQLAESKANAESVSAALSRRESELQAVELRAAEAAAVADNLRNGELPRLSAALAEAEARADKSEKLAASLTHELAVVNAAVREKDARLDDLRQELGGLRDAMAHGSASMKSEFAAMMERLCEEKDRQLADRKGELASLMERARSQVASTKPKLNDSELVVVEDDSTNNASDGRRSQSPGRSPKPSSPVNKSSINNKSMSLQPASVAARTPKSTPAPRVSGNVALSSQSAGTPDRQLNVKSPKSILRRQEPSAKRRKVHFNERDNSIELRSGDPPTSKTSKSPASSSTRTTKRLVLSPTVLSPGPSEPPAAAQAVNEGEEEDSDGFWFDSDLVFGQKKN